MSMMQRESGAAASNGATQRVAIVTESTSCLPDDLVRMYDIGIIPIPFVFGTQTYLDGVDITRTQFYEKLREMRMPPKTSPPSPGDYLQSWQQAARHADAVVCVTVDSKISTLQRSARLALEMAPEAMPGVPVTVVDSLSAGMGQGFVALVAARAARDGLPLAEIVKAAERVSQKMKVLVTLDTLEYLAKTSRIPQVAALIGGVLAIKPLIQIANGDILPLARVRTRRRSIEALFERMRELVPPGGRVHAAVQHAQAEVEAAQLEARIRETFDCAELYTTEFTPVMGGYCGPGLLGIAFYVEDADGQAGHDAR